MDDSRQYFWVKFFTFTSIAYLWNCWIMPGYCWVKLLESIFLVHSRINVKWVLAVSNFWFSRLSNYIRLVLSYLNRKCLFLVIIHSQEVHSSFINFHFRIQLPLKINDVRYLYFGYFRCLISSSIHRAVFW